MPGLGQCFPRTHRVGLPLQAAGRAGECALRDRLRALFTLQVQFPNTAKAIGMNKPAVTPVPEPKTLSEQKSDFTAEGSPPPGKVSTSVPDTSAEQAKATPPRRPVRETIRLKRPATRVNPQA